LITDYSKKELKPELSFIIVGAEFFRKGGREIVYTFDKLLDEGKNIKLHIVSSMEKNGYATENEYNATMELIRKHPNHIFKYEYLSNEEVLALCSKCHIGLMPTYADTFGYSVLEAQSAGCPVITTNVRALPEINSNDCGWIIPVPKNELGHADINTQAEREKFSTILRNGLENVILDIVNNPTQISSKGLNCIKRIKEKHDPDKAAIRVEEIYDKALQYDSIGPY
jgi:glycosyltransferase involved in cell wall biosynthesis